MTVPVNTTATVYVPLQHGIDAVTESGKPAQRADGMKFLRVEDGYGLFEVPAGQYTFESR